MTRAARASAWLGLLLTALGVTSVARRARADRPPDAAPAPGLAVRGVGLPMHRPDLDYGPLLGELPPLGASHVALFVHWYQRDAASPGPGPDAARTPSDEALRRAIRSARAVGLEVALVPSVLLSAPRKDEWRGNLRPPSWPAWFAVYRRQVVALAQLAEREGVAILAVGSELTSSEDQAAEWGGVIRAVRAEFRGRLTYAANWDHVRPVPFWEDLDAVGLSAYYELTTSPTPSAAELVAAWREVRDGLLAWRRERGLAQPFLLLEVGYPSVDGCAAHPWDYTSAAGVDLEEQRLCYEAFADAWRRVPELEGVFFYEWWGEGGARDRGYTPRGKPACDVVRELFGGRR